MKKKKLKKLFKQLKKASLFFIPLDPYEFYLIRPQSNEGWGSERESNDVCSGWGTRMEESQERGWGDVSDELEESGWGGEREDSGWEGNGWDR